MGIDGCCSCHLNPPCGYCTDRHDCARCGEQFYDPDGEETYCLRCQEEIDEENERNDSYGNT